MFLKNEKIKITVSELSVYFSCARKLYYSCRGHEPIYSSPLSYVEHIILKEMAMSFSHLLNTPSSKDDVLYEDIERVLTQVLEDILLIYPDEMEGVAPEVIDEASEHIKEYFDDMRQNLSSQAKVHDISRLAEKLLLLDKEPFMYSEKLNVTGIPYRLVEIDGSFIPVVIKTSSVPENGVWVSDRLHLTSFAMLAEDIYGSTVKSGFVLYARSGLFRKVSIHSTDRRQVLQAISRVRKIKEGTMPDKKESPLCNSCSYSDMCKVKASFASKFF
ncbi:Dna2/Cas4 domain-containing protein [Methanolobus mangrovi]|uniref:Dna2/Cas4 domain-containing protein n=1 Tax=Methanolobus mangrovi TaxID=3072977 RepID=A0AA51UEU0_9EURY|nr:Dna2/Cas4 domain-containing protein [Methanolobus mangrovi]WMW21653.1 Dna2/Cas4 domain-containing protein [Methanolobus mangrovi]